MKRDQSHNISYSSISGWLTPTGQSVTISYNTTTNATGLYVQETGALQVFIAPTGAVTAGAQWQVDGGAWQASGATVSNLVIGSHNFIYSSISGWLTPTGQSVTISYNTNTNATGVYVQETGSLQVFITPSGAVSAGAQWQVDGGAWQNSGATVANLPVGSHNINYSGITGWLTPTGQSVTISYNTTTNATGVYVQETGSLQVTITPAGAVSAGAQWQVDSGTLQNSGNTVGNLIVGTHTVSFSSISGWTTPANQNVTIAYDATTNITGNYVQLPASPFIYTTNADNTVTLAGYTGPGGDVVIPATNGDGLTVADIGAEAFMGDTLLTNIAFPASIVSVGDEAFANCSSLLTVALPNGVTNLGEGAFSDCSSLTNATLGLVLTDIESNTFAQCADLTFFTVPGSVTNIDDYAFDTCTDLQSVYFLGNAPNADALAFNNDIFTNYYLPGASGWSNTFAGAPVILWDPQIANDPSFGISNNQFGFNITGTNNFTVVVAASTNLNNPAWVPLTNGTLTNYLLYFSDPQWTNYPNRFYMLQMP